ncbi:radical SAM/SPASM domain-containing protein [Solidesulfovibrio sp.]|uniref:radical SAM/SPASM domain-containing protein n=1 Tax=Solidesulfovibrio sp. TaxID=2910990 RepID=UPI002607EE2B|nr:radical SAM/SPASM domain-containing protein [Solidesulfovibrio sp.]
MDGLKEKLVTDPRYRQGLERRLERPAVLVAPTNVCNLACAYCSTRNVHPPRRDMDVALAKSLIDQTLGNGWALSFGQTYEPFLHPRIEELVRHVHDKGSTFQSATNGLAIRRAAYDLPMNLLVSYSADEADFAHRGAKLSFDAYQKRLLAFFRHRLDKRVPGRLSVQIADYSIFRGDLTYDKKIADVDGILRKARLLAERLDLASAFDALDPKEALERIAARAPLVLFEAGDCRLEVQPTKIMPNSYDAFTDLPEPATPGGYCDSCWTMLSVQADGGAAFCCCDPAARAVAGRLTPETDLAAFWRGPEMERIRRGFREFRPVHAFCSRCLALTSERIKPLLTVHDPGLVAAILRERGVSQDLPWFAFPRG